MLSGKAVLATVFITAANTRHFTFTYFFIQTKPLVFKHHNARVLLPVWGTTFRRHSDDGGFKILTKTLWNQVASQMRRSFTDNHLFHLKPAATSRFTKSLRLYRRWNFKRLKHTSFKHLGILKINLIITLSVESLMWTQILAQNKPILSI